MPKKLNKNLATHILDTVANDRLFLERSVKLLSESVQDIREPGTLISEPDEDGETYDRTQYAVEGYGRDLYRVKHELELTLRYINYRIELTQDCFE